MKKILILMLAVTALLCGCGKEEVPETTAAPAVTTEATTAPTTEPTTVPTTEPAPVYTNPLTGEVIEGPHDRRIFGFTIGNTKESLPHYGVSKADILFESFVNGLTTRRFAMFSDVRDVQAVGGIRSMRVQWTDLCQGYDAVAIHAAGSGYVLGDMHTAGIDNIYGEQWDANFHYRDKERMRTGTSMEHCLYVRGADIVPYAESQGIRVTQDPEKDYGMVFGEIPGSAEGETADQVTITFKLSGREKPTIMTYVPEVGAYGLNQYGIDTTDGIYNNVPEYFKNVFALFFEYHGESSIYHVPETVGDGDGYFACEGKIIPIKWHRESNESPFTFTLSDGTPLLQGVGNNYIAMIPTGSDVAWEEMEVPATAPDVVAEQALAEEEAREAAAAEETMEQSEPAETDEAPQETKAETQPPRETKPRSNPQADPKDQDEIHVEVDD